MPTQTIAGRPAGRVCVPLSCNSTKLCLPSVISFSIKSLWSVVNGSPTTRSSALLVNSVMSGFEVPAALFAASIFTILRLDRWRNTGVSDKCYESRDWTTYFETVRHSQWNVLYRQHRRRTTSCCGHISLVWWTDISQRIICETNRYSLII